MLLVGLQSDCSPTNSTVYNIGDKGPAGGVVFYLTDNSGIHGLESAPVDQSSGAIWGCTGQTILDARNSSVGTGATNTMVIVSTCNENNIAAKIADTYTLNGYSDWFLPSKDELNLMYLQKDIIGGFVVSTYWSSTQIDNSFAWDQYIASGLNSGMQDLYAKAAALPVRAIRAF